MGKDLNHGNSVRNKKKIEKNCILTSLKNYKYTSCNLLLLSINSNRLYNNYVFQPCLNIKEVFTIMESYSKPVFICNLLLRK